jgi:predicted XRE-type DNA-binding protein
MMEERGKGPGGAKSVADWMRAARALGNQIDDPEAAAQAIRILDEMKAEIGKGINRLITEDNHSWTEVAKPCGVSRQAMRQRWGRKADRTSHFLDPSPIEHSQPL